MASGRRKRITPPEAQTARTPEAQKLTELIMEMFRLQGALERHGAKLTEPFGQTPARWQVLGACHNDQRTVAQIARRMGLSRQSVQRIANLLVDEGLARYADNPDHKRSPIVELTAKGERTIEAINAAQAEWSNGIADGLSARDLDRTARIIRDLTQRLDE